MAITPIYVVKNVSTNIVPLRDFGLVLSPDASIDLGRFDSAISSIELDNYMFNGDLVRFIDSSAVPYERSKEIFVPNQVAFAYTDSSLAQRDEEIELRLKESSLGFGVIYDVLSSKFVVDSSEFIPSVKFDSSINQLLNFINNLDSSVNEELNTKLNESSLGSQFFFDTSGFVNVSSSGFNIGLNWKYSNSTGASNPGSGQFRLNNTNVSLATALYISDENENGQDVTNFLASLNNGDTIYLQNLETSAESVVYTVDGTPIDNGSWYNVPLTLVDNQSNSFTEGKEFLGLFLFGTASSIAWGNINGTLSDQTDLQSALDLKADLSYIDASLAARDGSITSLFNETIRIDGSLNIIFDELNNLDASLDLYVLKSGDTMTGNLTVPSLSNTGDASIAGSIYIQDLSINGPASIDTNLLAIMTDTGKVVATSVPASNVATEVIDVSTDIDVSILRGFYYVDTTAGDVTLTIPDASIGNDGLLFSILKRNVDANQVIITTQGGIQDIGRNPIQTISQRDKGITIVGDNDNQKWLITSDSRFLEGSTQGEFQYWDVSAANWLPTTNDITWDNDGLIFTVGGNSTPATFQVDASLDIVLVNADPSALIGLLPVDDLAFFANGRYAYGNSVTIDRLRNNVPGNVPRALSLIDTTATIRVWRYVDDSNDPAVEFIWGLDDAPDSSLNAWWDMFLDGANDGTDNFAIRRRTEGNDKKVLTVFNDLMELDADASIFGELTIGDVSANIGSNTQNALIDVSNGNQVVTAGGHYGQEWQLAEDLTTSSTTSNSPQTKLTLTTTNLPAGKYKIDVGWLGTKSNANNDMIFDVTLNGTPQGTRSTMNIEAKDGTSIYPWRRVFYLDLSGVNTIALRFWRESTGTTTISDATIELMRVS